jgi:single-strand DNA-binding protein
MSLNTTNLVGRLTRDAELRYTPNGKAVANFTIAVAMDYKDDNGDRPADFINVVVWGVHAENVANFTGQGHLVSVSGRLESRSYENNDKFTVYVTEVNADAVHFISEPKDKENTDNGKQSNQNNQQTNKGGNNNKTNNNTRPNNRNQNNR